MGLADRDYMKKELKVYQPPNKNKRILVETRIRYKGKSFKYKVGKGYKYKVGLRAIQRKLKEGLIIIAIIVVIGVLLYGFDLVLHDMTGYRIAGIEEGGRMLSAGAGLISGNMKILKNPTFDEVQCFVKEDKTDMNYYSFYRYTCEDFSKDVIKNAKKRGIKVGFVGIETSNGLGHAIVAFDTIDKGLYFLEPQLDVIFSEDEMKMMLERRCYLISRDYSFYYEQFDFIPTGYTIDWSYIG